MTPLIALASPAPGSGKSEVAKYLVEHYGFTVVKFAGPLKAMTRTFYLELGLPDDEIEARIEGALKEQPIIQLGGVTSRHVQRTLGTEWGRQQIDDSLWVQIAISRASRLLCAGRPVVIDDMRFLNEMDAVMASGGECFAVMRPGYREMLPTHVSEGGLDYDAMHWINNDSDIPALHRRIESLLP